MLLLKSIARYLGISQRVNKKHGSEKSAYSARKMSVSSETNITRHLSEINNIGARCFLKSNNNVIKLLNLRVTSIIIN